MRNRYKGSRFGLAIHFKLSRQRVNMYSCTTCSKDLKSKQSLMYHMENRKTPCKRPTVVCPNCNKGLASKSSLYKHRKICSGSGLSDTQPGVSQSDSE